MPDGTFELPANPSLERLGKQAKERLALMRAEFEDEELEGEEEEV